MAEIEFGQLDLVQLPETTVAVIDPDPELAIAYAVRNAAVTLRIEQRTVGRADSYPEIAKLAGEGVLANKVVIRFESKPESKPVPGLQELGEALVNEAEQLDELRGEQLPIGLVDASNATKELKRQPLRYMPRRPGSGMRGGRLR